MKTTLFKLIQCTWGCIQSFIGLILFIMNIEKKHYNYHGAIVTEWDYRYGVSLGLFIFVKKSMNEHDYENEYTKKSVVHEYGHTIQSLILGPLYIIVIGIPSFIWCNFSAFKKYRRKNKISYYSFLIEKWANYLGEKITKEETFL